MSESLDAGKLSNRNEQRDRSRNASGNSGGSPDRARLFWKKMNAWYERILLIIFVLLLLIVLYCLYDTWYVYDHASDDSFLKYKPSAEEPDKLVDSPITKEYVAWLTVDDTNIDYPVMQGEDNTTFLNLDPYGKYSLSGSIFLDSRNAPEFTDDYSLVYGHHMEYGKMFGALDDFLSEKYLKSHSTGTLTVGRSVNAVFPLKIFAAMHADAKDKTVFSPTESVRTLEYIKNNAEYLIDYPEYEGKRILGLSTCSEADQTTRILVFCYILDEADTK